jgi:hypothetical protein
MVHVGGRLCPVTDRFDDENDELLPFGRAPRPAADDELATRVRELFVPPTDADWMVSGLDRLDVGAALDGADVTSLLVDASHVVMTLRDEVLRGNQPQQAVADESPAPARQRTEPATLRRGQFRAHPLRVQGIPTTIEATVEHMPFDWVELADGGLAIDVRHDEPSRRRDDSRVRLLVGTDVAQAVRTFLGTLRPALKEERMGIDRERVTLRQLGRRKVRFDVRARLKWRLLRVKGSFAGVLEVDRRNVLTLTKTRIGFTNPLLWLPGWALNRMAKPHLEKSVDLDAQLGTWRIDDLDIKAGGRVQIEVVLAPRA